MGGARRGAAQSHGLNPFVSQVGFFSPPPGRGANKQRRLNPFVSQVGFFAARHQAGLRPDDRGLNPFVSQVGFFVTEVLGTFADFSAVSQSLRKSGRFFLGG